ncbi:MAG: transketolase C-terminal domain-containing protein [Elusimicrobiota bacterium]|nr:transketolase C-terminal domain-containing protein [Elusimicrobiota bacterium]
MYRNVKGIVLKTKKILVLTGDQAAAEAMRQINPDVVAAYPITPQTEIVMNFAQFVADGLVDTEMIPIESEHSAMSACIGASAAGARAMTATSSQGLALMGEMLYIASGLRLPIVMPVVNRALSAPINIHGDHSDSMGVRDSGFIQLYCENAQEVYDLTIAAIRIAEHPEILLPVMVCQDGFITSHCSEQVNIYDDKDVKNFIGEYKPHYPLLDINHPVTYGPIDLQDYYFEHKRQQSEAMKKALEKIPEIFEEFKKAFGEKYDFIEKYNLDDAEIALLALSSTCGTAKAVVEQLRQKGIKAGMIKLQVFRPFPAEEIVTACKNLKALAVLDRAEALSACGGPVFTEVNSALFTANYQLSTINYIYGLGGRDIDTEQIQSVYQELQEIVKTGKIKSIVNYLGVR